jgi:hypothetical protein
MFMASSRASFAVVALLLGAFTATAADDRSGMQWLSVEFPRDSPIGVVSFSLGDSTATVRGISLALGLHTSLTLRNTSSKPVRGLTLLVQAQDLTPGGKASVTVPSLNVTPGEVFPVRLDLELMRPFNTTRNGGALVQVTLDCVLFDDLSAYGPDKLQSRRSLLVYEREARRDRQYFRTLIDTGQTAKLQEEMNFGIPDLRPPELGFELLKDFRRAEDSRALPVGFVPFPNAPVEMLNGAAKVYRNEVHTPEIHLQNRTHKTLQTIEVGWILRDNDGRDYMAGSLPARVAIGPVQQANILQGGVLRFSHPSGRPVLVDGVTAFISNVEFSDGDLWIPSRSDIAHANLDPSLRRVIANSPEQQRLVEIYRRRGMDALAAELKKGSK